MTISQLQMASSLQKWDLLELKPQPVLGRQTEPGCHLVTRQYIAGCLSQPHVFAFEMDRQGLHLYIQLPQLPRYIQRQYICVTPQPARMSTLLQTMWLAIDKLIRTGKPICKGEGVTTQCRTCILLETDTWDPLLSYKPSKHVKTCCMSILLTLKATQGMYWTVELVSMSDNLRLWHSSQVNKYCNLPNTLADSKFRYGCYFMNTKKALSGSSN